MLPLDLHVLGMPPAFNLSQDQTLQLKLVKLAKRVGSQIFELLFSIWATHRLKVCNLKP